MSTLRTGLHILFLLIGDTAVFFSSLYLSLAFRNLDPFVSPLFTDHLKAFLPLFVLYMLVLYIAGFWSRSLVPTTKNIFNLLLPAHTVSTLLMLGYFYLMPSLGLAPKTNLVIFATVLFFLTFIWKVIGLRLFTLEPKRAILIGPETELYNIFSNQPLWNVSISERLSYVSTLPEIKSALKKHKTNTIFVSIDRYPRIDILYELVFSNTNIVDTTLVKEETTSRVDLDKVDRTWFLTYIQPSSQTYLFLKRIFDIIGALILGIAYVIVLPFVYVAIKLEDGGPLFIKQQRVGLQGKKFYITKLRSMTPDEPGEEKFHNHEKQITKVGAFLRKTSIDEFPQIWSILKGELSFVGPRPEIPSLVEEYVSNIPYYNMRHLVRPGLSGWAQINQDEAPHHDSDLELTCEKLSYDLYFIKHNSMFLYCKIILRTLGKSFNRTNH